MDTVNRRRFLRQAVVGAGALPILGARAGVSAQVPTHIRDTRPPVFQDVNVRPVHGRILSLSGTMLAVDAVEGLTALSVVGARIWKGRAASTAHLQAGDVVWARGVPLPDGTLLVTNMWVNIVNVKGRVDTVVSSTTFVMQWGTFGVVGDSTKKTRVTVDALTLFNDGLPTSPFTLVVGQPVQVVGTAVDESNLYATRVFAQRGRRQA